MNYLTRKTATYRHVAYRGSRRRIQIIHIQPMQPVYAKSTYARPLTILPTLMFALALSLLMAFTLSHPAYAAAPTANLPNVTLADTAASAPDATDNATRIYITCPVEIYRGTAAEHEPADVLVDDFEDVPENWLYVLSPLAAGESYYFTLDLACHTQNSPFQGEISAVYSSCVQDDGSIGSVRIEATEQIAPDVYLVYYGEIKYISDGDLCLTQNDYGDFYDYHLFYFSLRSTDLPKNTRPLSEQRLSRFDNPAISATISITGDAECHSNVYDEDLTQSTYMYPYQQYTAKTSDQTISLF